MKCDPCRGMTPVPGCCHYPEPTQHQIIVEVELDVYADDDIEEQVEAALKAGDYDILTINGWNQPGLDN